jgi:hypothetical protein
MTCTTGYISLIGYRPSRYGGSVHNLAPKHRIRFYFEATSGLLFCTRFLGNFTILGVTQLTEELGAACCAPTGKTISTA